MRLLEGAREMESGRLPDEIKKYRERAPEIIEILEEKFGYSSMSVSLEEITRYVFSDKDSIITKPEVSNGTVFSGFNGGEVVELGIAETRPEELVKEAKKWTDNILERKPDHSFILENAEIGKERVIRHYISEFDEDFSDIPFEVKYEDLHRLVQRIISSDGRVKHARVVYTESRILKFFADRYKLLSQDLRFVSVSMNCYVTDRNMTRRNHEGNTSVGGYEKFREFTSEEKVRQVVNGAVEQLRAESIKPGIYQLLTTPLISGVIAHEAFGHGVETDMFLKKCARAQEYIGKQVAAPMVDMYDSPAGLTSAGYYYFDDEGFQASATQIIDKGILVSGITDFHSATLLGMKRTPNGRRENFRRKTYSRMSNTYIAPGREDVESLINKVQHGVLLKNGGSGMEDPLGWGIEISVQTGEEIRDGKFTGRVFSPLVLTGYVPDLLKSISGISRQFAATGLGKCGKTFRKDWIPVGSGGPYLLLEGRLT